MKRTKQRSFGSDKAGTEKDDYFAKAPAAPAPVWKDVEAKEDSAFVPYEMTTRFAKGAFVLHSKFGKGVVTDVDGARIEVLFESGAKKLGHTP